MQRFRFVIAVLFYQRNFQVNFSLFLYIASYAYTHNRCFSIEIRTIITKTYLYNLDPLKPHFYIVKLGFTGVYIIFFISAQNIDYVYSLEPPRRGGSNEYP